MSACIWWMSPCTCSQLNPSGDCGYGGGGSGRYCGWNSASSYYGGPCGSWAWALCSLALCSGLTATTLSIFLAVIGLSWSTKTSSIIFSTPASSHSLWIMLGKANLVLSLVLFSTLWILLAIISPTLIFSPLIILCMSTALQSNLRSVGGGVERSPHKI